MTAIGTHDVDPLTVGIQSPWGGGKSTLLRLLDAELASDKRLIVVRTDPWQYDNHDDVRGTLIAELLDQIRTSFDQNANIVTKVDELLGRISWSRVAGVLGKGLLTMNWNPIELAKAFTPKKRSEPESMAGFKDSFEELIALLPEIDRVVVLVDDLDRCLPAAVMATLEAIKLFLAVPRMVFVIAADHEMVRDAIAANLSRSNRDDRFANRYLEKIVQLPVSLPRLNQSDAEAYIGLLLSRRSAPDATSWSKATAHVADRRKQGLTPLLGSWPEPHWHPSAEDLAMAAQLAEGLGADDLANPRQIKRFLNAYGVRASVAKSRSINLAPGVLVKMLSARGSTPLGILRTCRNSQGRSRGAYICVD